VMCCSLWFLSFVWSKIFFNSPTHHQSRDWVMCCSLWFLLRLVLRVFQQSHPILPMKAGIEWCAALCDSFLYVWSYIFNSPTQFLPMKAGIEWCAALCDSFLCVWS
jgi:hypothetical protein